MKILTIAGTRPELIRLSIIIKKLDDIYGDDHIFVHTGQNYDDNLCKIFFEQLDIREPDYYLNSKGSFAKQIANILVKSEKILLKEKPDKFLVLGDTNSSTGAVIAKRLGIKVYHMEAGNRCYNPKSPEEVNRKIVDNCSDILLPYTEISKEKLLTEGFDIKDIYVTGNPIIEVIEKYRWEIGVSKILEDLNLKENNYFLVTMHRQENVDDKNRLKILIDSLKSINEKYKMPIVFPIHPRTKKMLGHLKIEDEIKNSIQFIDPQGFFDFLKLETNASAILTDSGTVQEEACILNRPCLVLRDTTERPETIQNGASIICGLNKESILRCLGVAINYDSKWNKVIEYQVQNTSDIVVKILSGNI